MTKNKIIISKEEPEEPIAKIEKAILEAFSRFECQPIEKNTIDQIYCQCANIMRDFIEKGYIEINNKIKIIYVNKEVDGMGWLCLLPLLYSCMSYGEYAVKNAYGQVIGQVKYKGMGEICIEDGIVMIGADTEYISA